jgi:hypothetical protein
MANTHTDSGKTPYSNQLVQDNINLWITLTHILVSFESDTTYRADCIRNIRGWRVSISLTCTTLYKNKLFDLCYCLLTIYRLVTNWTEQREVLLLSFSILPIYSNCYTPTLNISIYIYIITVFNAIWLNRIQVGWSQAGHCLSPCLRPYTTSIHHGGN